MIVDGNGLLGRRFVALDARDTQALIFARGVADSSCTDEAEYQRELGALENALSQARRLGMLLVYFSGAPIYGKFAGSVDEGTPIAPGTRYGLHQAHAEALIRAHPANHLIVRLPNVVGSGGNAKQLVPSLLLQARAGAVHVRAGASRDLIHVDDVARAVLALLAASVTNRTVIVASGVSSPVRDIAQWVIAEAGITANIVEQAGGDAQQFRIDLLRELAPTAAPLDSSYPRRVIAEVIGAEGQREAVGQRLPAKGPR